MRTALVRRTVLTASAVSLAVLATACGGSGNTDPKAAPSAPATSAAPAAKGKTDAEVAPLVVTQAELPDQVVSAEGAAKAAAVVTESDNAACKPLAQIQSAQKIGPATGIGRTAAKVKPKEPAAGASAEDKIEAGLLALGGDQTLVTVSSYDAKGAEEAFASVKAAGAACAGGYTVTSGGEKTKLDSVTQGAAVTGGDEAVSYTVVMDLEDGDKSTGHLVAVRKGNALATFYTWGLKAALPQGIVDAQVKKLG
ncbi:hypothetical protein [Streptomyces sp. NPDC002990]